MKVILEFDTTGGHDDENDVRTAMDGYKYKAVLWELDNAVLRGITKYCKSVVDPDKEASETEMEVADKIREEIRSLCYSWGVKLD